MGATISPPIQNVYQIKADTANVVTHSGNVAETTLKSYTIPGGTIGSNGVIRIKATGASRGNNGNKTYRLKFGGVEIIALTVAAGIPDKFWTLFAACHNLGAENSQNWSDFWIDEVTIDWNEAAIGTAINMANDQILEITGQLIDAADECEIRDWTIEINPAG